jgi:hypothetical protein
MTTQYQGEALMILDCNVLIKRSIKSFIALANYRSAIVAKDFDLSQEEALVILACNVLVKRSIKSFSKLQKSD